MTQGQRIIKWCDDYGSITSFQAFMELGITQLATRIRELEIDKGYEFERKQIKSKNRYGETVYFTEYILQGEEDYGTQEW